ncbi:MAG: adenylate kinase [Candidatus Aenigmatarchaeota archaeon]
MNLIFFGPPGSGKGTYASRVSSSLAIAHISTGDMFRAEVNANTKLGKLADKYMKAGKLVPDKITINMLKKRIKKPDCKNGFILDGFPRTIAQMKALEKIVKIDLVLNFKLPEKMIIQKTLARRVCEKCGAIYNIADIKVKNIHLPPLLPKKDGICDKCGGHLIQRKDDNIKTIKDRLNIYKKQTKPLLEYYKKKRLMKNINVIGPPEVMVPIIIDEIKKNFETNI